MKQLAIVFILFSIVLCTSILAKDFSGFSYLFPRPDSEYLPSNTTIIIRFEQNQFRSDAGFSGFISVYGSESGLVNGTTKVASDNKTIIFTPEQAFLPGENVSVSIYPNVISAPAEPINFEFQILEQAANEYHNERSPEEAAIQTNSVQKSTAAGIPMIMPNGVSVPGDFPHINVTINKRTADGYIFINNWRDDDPYNIIFQNDGSPVWYQRFPYGDRRRDFKIQKNNTISMLTRYGGERHVGYDINFNYLGEYVPVDGYSTDEHELQVLEDGGYLLIGRRVEQIDMSRYVSGGRTNAEVRETIIQEFTANHEKIFEWRAWDNFDIRDVQLEDLRGSFIRFPHMNAIDIDDDGQILLSSRHLSEVTKIQRERGYIIWRLGGAHSSFVFLKDELGGFTNQHDIRALGNGHYTVFDNGNLHSPLRSRAVEYELDTVGNIATLVWEYRNPSGTSDSYYMGNAQRLPNGNTLINWAVSDRPKATEVTPLGEVVYEMNFVGGYHTYRTFRFPWNGVVEKPSLYVETLRDQIALIFNKFGDHDVSYYNIYAGKQSAPTTLIDTSKTTLKYVSSLPEDGIYYFRVTAVYEDGSESEFSNEESASWINTTNPNQNLIINGDFSQQDNSWVFELQGGDAELAFDDEVCHFEISNGADQVYAVQLRQNGLPLITGQKYRFEFDAWATIARTIEAKVGQDVSPWTNYSQIGLTALSRSKRHYSYDFIMQDLSDGNARVVINTGNSNEDVFLDNVSLLLVDETAASSGHTIEFTDYQCLGAYPNPFNAVATIRFQVPQTSFITISLFNLLGQLEQTIVNASFEPGIHNVRLNAESLSSGVYFYKFYAHSPDHQHTFSDVQKVLLLK